MSRTLDFSADALTLGYAMYENASITAKPFWWQDRRNHFMYSMYQSGMGDSLPSIMSPKLFGAVEEKAAAESERIFSTEPWLKLTTDNESLMPVVRTQAKLLHALLRDSDFVTEATYANKIKICNGTSFMDLVPTRTKAKVSYPVPDGLGGFRKISFDYMKFGLRPRCYASWEILLDPDATSLSHRHGCRYAIKFSWVSKRELMEMIQENPKGFTVQGQPYDPEKLDFVRSQPSRDYAAKFDLANFAQRVMQEMGLPTPPTDGDMGLYLRFEMPDRYFDIWDGKHCVRDITNPMHDLINLSCWKHRLNATTSHRMYGIGEIKRNEIGAHLWADYMSMMLMKFEQTVHPFMFYREGGINPDLLVSAPNNRIPVDTDSDKPITADFFVYQGQGATPAEFEMISRLEDNIDDGVQGSPPTLSAADRMQKTATEIATISNVSDINTEAIFRVGTQECFRDMAFKALKIVDRFSTPLDREMILGRELAQLMYAVDPSELPGLIYTAVEGAGHMQKKAQEQDAALKVYPAAVQYIMAGQYTAATELMTKFDISDSIQKRIMVETVQEQQKQMQMALVAQQLQTPESKPKSGPKEVKQVA